MAIAGVVLLVACSGSGRSTRPSTTTTRARAAKATFEIRPVLAILPPGTARPFFNLPPGGEVLSSRSSLGPRYAVGPAAVTGTSLRSAKAQYVPEEGWVIDLTLDQQGIEQFNALAAQLFPKQPPGNSVALVVDGVVQSAPAMRTPRFESGSIQVSGGFTERQAKTLAASLAP